MDLGVFVNLPANESLFPCTTAQCSVRPVSGVDVCIVLEKQFHGLSVIPISSPHRDGGDRLERHVKWVMEVCEKVKVLQPGVSD